MLSLKTACQRHRPKSRFRVVGYVKITLIGRLLASKKRLKLIVGVGIIPNPSLTMARSCPALSTPSASWMRHQPGQPGLLMRSVVALALSVCNASLHSGSFVAGREKAINAAAAVREQKTVHFEGEALP